MPVVKPSAFVAVTLTVTVVFPSFSLSSFSSFVQPLSLEFLTDTTSIDGAGLAIFTSAQQSSSEMFPALSSA